MILREEYVGGRDNGASSTNTRGLNRDQAVQISRLNSGKSFIGK